MLPGRVQGATRVLGPPAREGDEEPTVLPLAIRDEIFDGVPYMISAWVPNTQELAEIMAGAPVYVWIVGEHHPPIHVTTGRVPTDEEL